VHIVTPADHRIVLANTKGAFRESIIVLEATRARPGEIAAATAEDYDDDREAIVYKANPEPGKKQHKTHRTGQACWAKPRLIVPSRSVL
jgi:hypothetical protein